MKRATIITDIPDHNGKPIDENQMTIWEDENESGT